MMSEMLTFGGTGANPWGMKKIMVLFGSVAALALGGCVQIQAPSKPIEINLNVNIRQEVVLSLKKDAQDLVTNNPELFPQ